jgi:hypothetical protein
MTDRTESLSSLPDTVLASSLVASPAWASWLGEVNQLLTTATLIIGVVLGSARLWNFIAERRKSRTS